MRFSVVNLGCKVNRVESDSIAASYVSRGGVSVPLEQAELVVVNTCTVTGAAEKKTRKAVRHVLRANPEARVLVTGCAAAINPSFFEQLDPRVSVVGKRDLLGGPIGHGDALDAPNAQKAVSLRVGEGYPTRVGIKVQDGCNHSCSYCIVHVARGRAWSRPVDEVLAEAAALDAAGVRELVLTGIDLGSYRSESGCLGDLLSDLLVAAPHARLRISSVEPCSLDEATIELLAASEGRICRHLHLPLQSGSTKVLHEMNRPYTAEFFAGLAARLKNEVPGMALSTDIIAGFPGESDAEFDETMALAREVGFSKIHAFRYSRRAGTPAAARADQIDPCLAEQRVSQLVTLSDELRRADAAARLGTTEQVVVLSDGEGVSESYHRVEAPAFAKPGSMVPLTFTGIDDSGILQA